MEFRFRITAVPLESVSLAIVKYVTGTRKIAREIRASRDDVKIFDVPRDAEGDEGNDCVGNKGMLFENYLPVLGSDYD